MGSVVKSVLAAPEMVVARLFRETLNITGDVLEGIGLKSLGKEVDRWGDDLEQVIKVTSGQYHNDMKEIEAYKQQVNEKQNQYNSGMDTLVNKMESLIAFHEIFQLAMSNKMDNYYKQYGPEIAAMMEKYKAMVAQLQNEYDFVIGLTQGSFIQRIVGSLVMIIGGIMSDLGDIMSGKADGDTWKRIVTVVILVIVIVFMWWNPLGWASIAALSTLTIVMITIGAFLTLDSMYANSAAMGGIMSCLDFIFNDLLNLDDTVGKDFDKFDKDHEDYAEMVMYTRLAFTIATMIAAWGTTTPPPATTAANGTVVTESMGGIVQTTATTANGVTNTATTIFGISTNTYSSIYSAYNAAVSVNDVVNANAAYEELKIKLNEDRLALESAIDSKYRKNFMKHYKDTAYFLQDQQENIDRYVWSMGAQNMYVDPYGTTPVANIRFEPDKDTRVMAFGFEDMFDETKVAGSKNYFNSILYG